MAYKDPEKRREYARQHYQENSAKYKAAARRHDNRVLLYLDDARRGPCKDCGNTFHPWQMEFDHRPGEDKVGTISHVAKSGLPALKRELEKCDLVCANCHRHRTHQRGQQRKRDY